MSNYDNTNDYQIEENWQPLLSDEYFWLHITLFEPQELFTLNLCI